MEYINKQKFRENSKEILTKNGEKFDTFKEMFEFVLGEFTDEQIEETLLYQPKGNTKSKFWYAARKAYIDKIEILYKIAQEDKEGPYYKMDIVAIDHSFHNEMGMDKFFFESVQEYAEFLEKVEACGLGDVFRGIGGIC